MWEPFDAPAGIVTVTVEVPLAGTGSGAMDPERVVPLGLSRCTPNDSSASTPRSAFTVTATVLETCPATKVSVPDLAT